MVVVRSIERASTFAWSNSKQPKLALGSASGKIDANFSNDSKLEIWDCLHDTEGATKSITASSKFMDLVWSKDDSTIVGGLDNGVVEFYSAPTESEETKIIASIKAHTSSVQALAFSKVNENHLATGDANGLINIWDIKSISDSTYKPTTSGETITNVDNVKSLAWNNRIGHIFASGGSSSGFASIWDLNQRKEILHIGYTNPETNQKLSLDVVQWHPTSGTIISTASNSDLNPAVILWDLRKANTPLEVMKQGGHSKGVLSLDWCSKDAGLLLSSSADNTVCLWDPETTKSLLQVYPPRSNWVFKAKFAPELPDFFATASHDSLIEIQQLQDLTVDPKVVDLLGHGETVEESLVQPKPDQNDDDFWNSISQPNNTGSKVKTAGNTTKWLKTANQSKNISMHVPKWIYENKKVNPAATWAFGGKMVKINADGKSVSVFSQPKDIVSTTDLQKQYELLQGALNKKDFNAIISKRVNLAINENNEDDWNLLDKISLDGKETFFKEALALDESELESAEDKETVEEEEFFEKLEQDKFDVLKDDTAYEFSSDEIFKNLVNKDFKKATDLKLQKNDMLEALVIANISNDADLKEKVLNEYFFKNASKSSSSRLLFALSEGKFEDLIAKTDASNWKYIAKAIKNYVSDDVEKTSLYNQLGDKLYSAGKRQDALVLFMSSGILDKVGNIWIEELQDIEQNLRASKNSAYAAHMESLTEFVERFSCFANFFESNNSLISNNPKIVSIILEFVNTICISGNFSLALDFLNILPADNSDVATEKQRVLIASGKGIQLSGNAVQNKNTAKNSISFASSANMTKTGSILQPKAQLVTSTNVLPKSASPIPSAPRNGSVYAPKSGSMNNSIYSSIPQPKAGHAKAAVYAPPQAPVPVNSVKDSSFNSVVPPPVAKTFSAVAQQPSVPSVHNPYEPKAKIIAPTTPHSYQQQSTEQVVSQTLPPPPLSQTRGVIQPQIITSTSAVEIKDTLNKPAPGMVSGQKPIGNKHANAGWNDFALPIPDTNVRAKPIGVKKESDVASSTVVTPVQQMPNDQSSASKVPSKSVLPPPPIASRASSNKNLLDMQAASKKRTVSEKSTKYAPQVVSLPQTNNSPLPIKSPIVESKPVAAPPVFNNPYAPPTQTVPPKAGKMASLHPPVSSKGVNGKSSSTTPSVLPPPIKRKVQNETSTVPPLPLSQVSDETVIEEKNPPAESTMLVGEEKESIQEDNNDEFVSVFTAEEGVRIQNYFNDRMPAVTENLPEKFAAQIKDTQKRIAILSNHLKKQDLIKNRDVIVKLLGILDALETTDFAVAKSLQSEIASEYPEEAGKWLTGVKRFIGFAEVYESKK